MRNTIVSREYVFRHEVIPLLVIGILLNLLGFFSTEKMLVESGLFLDMVGTVFTSILLGPWWGASVGVLTNIVNGTMSSNYFPFGIVHITGALFFGYYARAFNFGRILPGLPGFRVSRFVLHFVVLIIVGGMVTGGTSSIVKLILYPIMERPWIVNDTQKTIMAVIRSIGIDSASDELALLVWDIRRDLLDKFVSFTLVTAVISWIVFLPNRYLTEDNLKQVHKIKTDNVSVLFFFLCYGFYLFAARVARPVISISGAKNDLSWLTSIPVIFMLYAPVLLAMLVFLLFSLEPSLKEGRLVELKYQMKRRLYFRFSKEVQGHAGSLSIAGARSLLQKYNVYGLVVSAAMWPISKLKTSKTADGDYETFVLVYIIVIVLYMFAFLLENNSFVRRVLSAHGWMSPLKKWLTINSGSREALSLAQSLKDLFEKSVNISDNEPLGYGGIVYFPVSKQLKTADYVSVKNDMENAFLVIIPDSPRILTKENMADIEQILSLTGMNQAFVLSLCPMLFDNSIKKWLKANRAKDNYLAILSWIDLELLIEQFVSGRFQQKGFYDAILHTLEQLGEHDSYWSQMSITPGKLQRRSLPVLKHIMTRLDQFHRVLDIGAGLGRHSLLALENRQDVVSIEIKESAVEQLSSNLKSALKKFNLSEKKSLVVQQDYMNCDAADIGEVDLIIAAGVLQHAKSAEDLHIRLQKILSFAHKPGTRIYIECLLDMRFDEKSPKDGRYKVNQAEFETHLLQVFPDPQWRIERLFGPSRKSQDFQQGPTSFIPTAKKVEVTTVEYLIEQSYVHGQPGF